MYFSRVGVKSSRDRLQEKEETRGKRRHTNFSVVDVLHIVWDVPNIVADVLIIHDCRVAYSLVVIVREEHANYQ